MRNKNIFTLFGLWGLALMLLVPFQIPAAAATDLPVLPNIGKVTISEYKSTGWEGRSPDSKRFSDLDYVIVKIEDDKGNAYPSEVTKNGITAFVTIGLTLKRGDGKSCFESISGIGCNLGGKNIASGQVNIGNPPGNGEICVYDKGCTYPLDRDDLVRGAPIPGPVTLDRAVAESWVFPSGTQQKLTSNVVTPNLALFTVADPPKIDTLSKATAKHGETVTLTGVNFDAQGAGKYLWADRVAFDLDRDTLQSGRVINDFSATEDLVHYCSATKVNVDIPSDLSVGSHTLTLFNEFGYSNTFDIEVASGSGTAANDPACAGSSGSITSLSPSSGPVGATVIINGTGFGSATSGATANIVKFNGTEAVGASVNYSRTQITIPVPKGATTGKVTVKPQGGYLITGPTFTVTKGSPADLAVKITSLFPTSGTVGTQVTVNGSGFTTTDNTINFGSGYIKNLASTGGQTLKFTVPTTLDLCPPAGGTCNNSAASVTPGAYDVSVTNSSGTSYLVLFTVKTGGTDTKTLSITSITPSTFYTDRRTTALLEGTGFTSDAVVTTNSADVLISDAVAGSDGTTLRAVFTPVARSSGSITITVSASGLAATIQATLGVKNSLAPEITAVTVNPLDTQGRGKVIASGTNFTNVTDFEILGLPWVNVDDFKVVSDTRLDADITVLDFNPNAFSLIRQALAASNDPGLIFVQKSEGADSFPVDDNKFDRILENTPPNPSPAAVPATGFEDICKVQENGLATCIKQLYLFSLGLGSIIALLMIVLAGFRYMTASGNAQQVEGAKESFSAAFIGLIIIFIAFILLYVINPDLVHFKKLDLPAIPAPPTSSQSR